MEGDGIRHRRCRGHRSISIHSLRMEGDYTGICPVCDHLISIHSLRMEGDTIHGFQHHAVILISIHSLRMEGDSAIPSRWAGFSHFNPLPPHGGRHTAGNRHLRACVFQSTPSAWRETAKLHRKAFFISPILVQSCKKGCKRLHSAPEKMVFFEKREKNLVRNLQHLSVRL